jgi:phosphate transport system permease protein
VIPLALPGIITGSIIALARALGETAPLLMIGMMAFVANPPASPLEPSTALPVQIYTWAKNPEPRFIANAAAAIIFLMLILIVINVIAIVLRKKFEKKL